MKYTFKLFTFLLGSSFVFMANARVIHVTSTGSDNNSGDKSSPFLTISKAASVAIAGDTVMIHKGTYREWVSPANSGINQAKRVTYMALPGDIVELKGSERISTWEKKDNGIWSAEIPNTLFGDFNPFEIKLFGDWLQRGWDLHLGEVYTNNKALKEANSIEQVNKTIGRWYATVNDKKTTIKANFGNDYDPNKELTEINVRPACFFPKTTGINYIEVNGLKISQAATQWSAPTSEQIGIIGPNWSKGWIIENCEISNSKCVGICLGKDRASGHNMWSLYRSKNGYTKCGFNREIESIIKAYDLGWSKENIGSHLIQNNIIHDCGQSGIVGHMGAAFSTIKNNEIYNINKTEGKLSGAETAGIKLHAAIDTRIEHNIITNCVRGIWLDWQAQGTHVTSNVISDSEQQDLFIEVSHGPTLVYNNILLSNMGILLNAQGIAFMNNLIAGKIEVISSSERYTPYHDAHSTKMKGLFNNNGGDLRFYNNIFLGNGTEKSNGKNGLSCLNRFPASTNHLSDSIRVVKDYLTVRFPIWCSGNIYFNNATPYINETNYNKVDKNITINLIKKDNTYCLESSLKVNDIKKYNTIPVNTKMLGETFISEALFDNSDCSDFYLDKDILGNKRDIKHPICGPFEKASNSISFSWSSSIDPE